MENRVSSTGNSEELQISGNTIPTVEQFAYLGPTVQKKGSSDRESEKMLSEIISVLSMLN
jgi:hypothetical protein